MEMSRLELRNEKIEQLKTIVNMNFAVSHFVPVAVRGNIVDVAFLYSSSPIIERTRPFAKVVFDHNRGSLVEFRNAYFNDFMDSEEFPMTTKINYSLPSEISVAEIGMAIQIINSSYDEICELAFKDDVSEEGAEKIREYKEMFYKSTPEALLPYYEALSPEFFQWLNKF